VPENNRELKREPRPKDRGSLLAGDVILEVEQELATNQSDRVFKVVELAGRDDVKTQ
jgi:hypothetical protein